MQPEHDVLVIRVARALEPVDPLDDSVLGATVGTARMATHSTVTHDERFGVTVGLEDRERLGHRVRSPERGASLTTPS